MAIDDYFDIPTMIVTYDPETKSHKYELTVSTSITVSDDMGLLSPYGLDDWKVFRALKEQLIQDVYHFSAFTVNDMSERISRKDADE